MGIRCFMVERAPELGYVYELEDGTKIGPLTEPPDDWETGRPMYRRLDTGALITSPLPPGACFDALAGQDPDERSYRTGADGRSIVVVCPDGHHWYVDGRANNCASPDDDEHRCWVRHGEPPELTVDKDGNTCTAGAGSIQTPEWHGFLRNGELVV